MIFNIVGIKGSLFHFTFLSSLLTVLSTHSLFCSYFFFFYSSSSLFFSSFLPVNPSLFLLPSLPLSLQLTVDRDETVETLLETLYFYLDPATCLCDSMQYVAEDMYLLSDYSCNTTHDSNCTEIFCQVEGNTLESVTYDLYQCTSPNPTFELSMVLSSQTYSLNVTDNTTRTITTDGLVLNVIINVWYFNYSMDLQVSE